MLYLFVDIYYMMHVMFVWHDNYMYVLLWISKSYIPETGNVNYCSFCVGNLHSVFLVVAV